MKTWMNLTDEQRRVVRTLMDSHSGESKNGVAGWYHYQRHRHLQLEMDDGVIQDLIELQT